MVFCWISAKVVEILRKFKESTNIYFTITSLIKSHRSFNSRLAASYSGAIEDRQMALCKIDSDVENIYYKGRKERSNCIVVEFIFLEGTVSFKSTRKPKGKNIFIKYDLSQRIEL